MSENSRNPDSPRQDVASTKKMIFYAFGFVLTSHLIIAFDSYIFYFYEVEIGLPVLLISLAVIIVTVWTIIASPIIGFLTDRPFKWSRRWGFRAPWIFITAIPSLLLFVLVFIPPNVNPKSNPWPIFFYFIIIACIFEVLFSTYRQHHSGIFAMLFREDTDRKKATMLLYIVSTPISLILSLVPLTFIVYGDKSSFFMAAIIIALIMLICLLLTMPGVYETKIIKERFFQGYRNKEKISFLKICNISFRTKNFTISLISFAFAYVSLMLVIASSIYFFKDVLKLPLSYGIIPAVGSFIAMTLSMPLWNRLSQKLDHAKIYMLGVLMSALVLIPLLWITTIEEYIIISIIRGVATSGFIFMFQPIAADCYDEITLKCERHLEATLHGLRNVIFRSSAICIAIVLALVHIATNYDPNPKAVQSPLAVWGVRVHTALIPIIFYVLAFITIQFYDLKGEKKIAIRKMLHEKGL
jgi:Na+/melibiose symporter-like transporter